MPCSRSVLPRAKAGRGIDFKPPNGLAAVAGVRDSGVSVVVDTPKNLAIRHPRRLRRFCHLRPGGGRADRLDCLVHAGRYGSSPYCRIGS